MLLVKKNWNSFPRMESFLNDFFGSENLSFNKSNNVNITENENSYGIELALPGYSKDDVNIEIKDGIITISNVTEKKDNNNYFKSSFENSYYLPDDVDNENINASMENGILSITLNKIKVIEDKPTIKKIEIK